MTMQPYKAMSNSMTYEDSVSIAATSSGVSGTITVPKGVHLIGMDIVFTGAAGAIPTIIKLSWPSSPQPLSFTPNLQSVFATPGGGISTMNGIAIPLDVIVKDATVVTLTVTSTANVTVQIGLRW